MSRSSLGRVLLGCALVSLFALAACSAPPQESVTRTQRVRVSGSGTALPVVHVLTDEYAANNPDVEFVYLPGLHSSGGIRGVANGDLEIGAVSRPLSEEEQAMGLTYQHLSDDGLVIAVHPGTGIDKLTSEQVREIYRGVYDNWSELGGEDVPIVILDRNEEESAKVILRQYVLGPDLEVTPKAVNLFYEPDMVEAVQNTPGAIGYFSLGFGISEQIDVTCLALDGVKPSVETVDDGAYKVIRPLGVVVSPQSDDEIVAFLEWTQSDEALDLIESRGFARPQTPSE